MPGALLDPGYVDWYCPECGKTTRTRPVPNRWHPCPRLKGISAPMLRKGVSGSIRIVERQDYVGSERVQLLGEDKRPVMSLVTTRDHGQDAVVYAPMVVGRKRR